MADTWIKPVDIESMPYIYIVPMKRADGNGNGKIDSISEADRAVVEYAKEEYTGIPDSLELMKYHIVQIKFLIDYFKDNGINVSAEAAKAAKLEKIDKMPNLFRYMSEEDRNNKDIAMLACIKSGRNLPFIGEKLRVDKAFIELIGKAIDPLIRDSADYKDLLKSL